MGQKVNPIGFRLGYTHPWNATWFTKKKKQFANNLIEDHQIRTFIHKRITKSSIAKINIERNAKKNIIHIYTAKPGLVIGPQGKVVNELKEVLKKIISKDLHINIISMKKPELNAKLLADTVVEQIEARNPYKRVIKQSLAMVMLAEASGVKIQISGRLNGAEMARTETYKEGRIPLQTLRAYVDYHFVAAQTVYGKIGIKVWIFTKEIYDLKNTSNFLNTNAKSQNDFGKQRSFQRRQ